MENRKFVLNQKEMLDQHNYLRRYVPYNVDAVMVREGKTIKCQPALEGGLVFVGNIICTLKVFDYFGNILYLNSPTSMTLPVLLPMHYVGKCFYNPHTKEMETPILKVVRDYFGADVGDLSIVGGSFVCLEEKNLMVVFLNNKLIYYDKTKSDDQRQQIEIDKKYWEEYFISLHFDIFGLINKQRAIEKIFQL